MDPVTQTPFERYQPWRRSVEVGFWVVTYLFSAIGNSLTVNMDVSRLDLGFARWEPVA